MPRRKNSRPSSSGHRRLPALGLAGAAGAALVAAPALLRRVVVSGRSMEPALGPGDRLVVVRVPAWWPIADGSMVAVHDPRRPGRLLVKRVASSGPAGVVLRGDNPVASTDSRTFGPVPRRSIAGVACYRYAPSGRAGRLGGRSAPGRRKPAAVRSRR
ncbi:MAG: nickel-type superoxide dismutase maturation protease [Acidimicrobiales bacterium]